MIIKSLRVANFRSLLSATLNCESLTAFVGPNGAGKSSFLRALELFYSASSSVAKDDFYNRDTALEIEIAVTFKDLTPQEESRFQSRMSGTELQVVRIFNANGGKSSGKYYGFTLRHPAFDDVRGFSGREFLKEYKTMAEATGLPAARSESAAREAMDTWEATHRDDLELGRDDGQFFGFTNVARGYLGDLTRFLFIPAVRDAEDDANEGRSSAITELMDLVVRSTLSRREDLVAFKAEVQNRYGTITSPENLPELGQLASDLTDTLRQLYSSAGVKLDWLKADEINLPLPKAEVKIVEDGFEMAVHRMGHGLQRAFVMTLLQHLAIASTPKGTGEPADVPEGVQSAKPELNLIIGIEEPELYQHPSRQRHFSRILLALASGRINGVADRTQVLYATHSSLLVDIERFNQVRRITRISQPSPAPKASSVMETTWDRIADILWDADGRPEPRFTGESLVPRMASLMTPWMNEGFFADTVVLVEGEDDRAAIVGMAQLNDVDFEAIGCTIIPSLGKENMDRPAIIFRELGIPTYLIWDGDHSAQENHNSEDSKKTNRRLLNICGAPEEDWPCAVSGGHACFRVNLEKTLEDEIGVELFNGLVAEHGKALGFPKKKHALKNPIIIHKILSIAAAQGKKSPTVEAIVNAIRAKANNSHAANSARAAVPATATSQL